MHRIGPDDLQPQDVLKQGVRTWNDWRNDKGFLGGRRGGRDPYVMVIDLMMADLEGRDLHGIDFSSVSLTGANFHRANLANANFEWSNLKRACFVNADLKNANFHRANLDSANLTHATVKGTNFQQTYLRNTVFANTDLTEALELSKCRHLGPSVLDHLTLSRSGRLPDEFLRGCGLPDAMIKEANKHRRTIDEYRTCFISYSSVDHSFASMLYSDLQEKGVRCWFAPEDMTPARKMYLQVGDAIKHHEKLLLILSENSIGSAWVEHEIRSARKREKQESRQLLVPISITTFDNIRAWQLFDSDEGRDLASEIREYYIPDFSRWENRSEYQKAFRRLLESLRANS